MAKWARRSGGRKRWRWVIEHVPPASCEDKLPEPDQTDPDPFSFDTPEAIVAALWRFEQRKLLAGAADAETGESIADG